MQKSSIELCLLHHHRHPRFESHAHPALRHLNTLDKPQNHLIVPAIKPSGSRRVYELLKRVTAATLISHSTVLLSIVFHALSNDGLTAALSTAEGVVTKTGVVTAELPVDGLTVSHTIDEGVATKTGVVTKPGVVTGRRRR